MGNRGGGAVIRPSEPKSGGCGVLQISLVVGAGGLLLGLLVGGFVFALVCGIFEICGIFDALRAFMNARTRKLLESKKEG